MSRWGWLTDIHLNFLATPQLRAFSAALRAQALDGLLITGDIAEASSFAGYLEYLESSLQIPICFVLGNHDCYGSDIASVRCEARALGAGSPHLRWLGDGLVVPVSPDTALIGHDGWADGRNGDYAGSGVLLSDYFMIGDFVDLDRGRRLEKLRGLGDEAAAYFGALLPRALQEYAHVILLTHVPPFRESCWYDGQISGDEYLPHFSCKAAGDALLDTMHRHPHRRLTVLCGHTHGGGVAQIARNLVVKTGEAEYSAPRLQEVILV